MGAMTARMNAASYERLIEGAVVALVSGFISMVWFASRAIRDMDKSTWRQVIGACLFSATTGGVASLIFMAVGIEPVLASPMGSIVGVMGEKGFDYLVRNNLPGSKD